VRSALPAVPSLKPVHAPSAGVPFVGGEPPLPALVPARQEHEQEEGVADGTGDLDSEEEQSEEEEDSSSENEEAADSCRLHVDAGIPVQASMASNIMLRRTCGIIVCRSGQDAARTCCQINKWLSI
jgi:hypothetical protein